MLKSEGAFALRSLAMSQDDLAKIFGVSRPCVSMWANGKTKPSLEFRKMAHERFGIETDSWDRPVRKANQSIPSGAELGTLVPFRRPGPKPKSPPEPPPEPVGVPGMSDDVPAYLLTVTGPRSRRTKPRTEAERDETGDEHLDSLFDALDEPGRTLLEKTRVLKDIEAIRTIRDKRTPFFQRPEWAGIRARAEEWGRKNPEKAAALAEVFEHLENDNGETT